MSFAGCTTPDPSDAAAVHCLLLLKRWHDAPAGVVCGLRRRNVAVREAHDAPSAMAALAGGRFQILLIVEPNEWRDLTPLIGAVRRYHPVVAVWRYRWSCEPRLCRMEAGAGEESVPTAERPVLVDDPCDPETVDASRRLFTGKNQEVRGEREPVHRSAVVLTASELAMLLRGGMDGGDEASIRTLERRT